jgi:hypothetical protein
MALKTTLETIEGLPEPIAKEYKLTEVDGKKVYQLDLDGVEDTGALKRAKEHEKSARQAAEKQAKELAARQEAIQEELDQMRRGAIPKGDVEKLEGSWKDKLAKKEAELTGERDAALGTLKTLLVDNVAQSLASKISNSPDLMLPHIKARLMTEKTAEGYVTRVLDKEGKPSALSIEELQKELTTDKRFAAIIIGSKASGGGATGGSGAGSGAPVVDPKFDWAKATPSQIAAQLKALKEARGQGGQ